MAAEKPYRDDDRATVERSEALQRRLETVTSDDASRRPLEAEMSELWARQFEAEVHRGAIVKVVPRYRWAPRPKPQIDPHFRQKLAAAFAVVTIVLGWLAAKSLDLRLP